MHGSVAVWKMSRRLKEVDFELSLQGMLHLCVYKCATRLALPLHKFVFVLLANNIVRTVFFLFPHYSGSAVASQFTSCELNGSAWISSCRYPSDSRHSHRPFTDSKAFTVPPAVDPRVQGSTSRRVEISGAGDSRILHQRVESCACDAGYGFFTTKIWGISFGCQFVWKLSGRSFCILWQYNCLLELLVRAVYPTMMKDVDKFLLDGRIAGNAQGDDAGDQGNELQEIIVPAISDSANWFDSIHKIPVHVVWIVCVWARCVVPRDTEGRISSYHFLVSFPYYCLEKGDLVFECGGPGVTEQ